MNHPSRLLLTPEEIQKWNEENLKKPDLLLCRIKDLKEEWTGEEILTLLKEDWKRFGKTVEVRYGRAGIPLGDSFWSELQNHLDQDSLKERNQMLFGLITKRTDIRVFPTDEPLMSTPANDKFDRLQHSSISPGSSVGIYHFSRDKHWAYVQTPFIRGWVRVADLAIAKERSEVTDYEEAKERLVVTGSSIPVFSIPSFQEKVFLAQMGTSFPVLSRSYGNSTQGTAGLSGRYHLIRIPFREVNGRLTFREGYIPKEEDVQTGFLPFAQENIALQAFKMLHQPYGWGEMFEGRDCSRFIMDLFATFGIAMPRNSKQQAQVGIAPGLVEGKTLKEKQRVLDRAIPLATTLRLPGHIMLYLGKADGRYYVIHSIWGIQEKRRSGPVLDKIGKVVVSDLSLGGSVPHGSLMHRLTDIRLIGFKMRNSP